MNVDLGAQTVAKLIGCTLSELKLALSTRKMKVGNDNIVQKLTLSQVCCTPLFEVTFSTMGDSFASLSVM